MSETPRTMLELAATWVDAADVLRRSHGRPEAIQITNLFAYACLMDERLAAAQARVEALRQEVEGLRAFKRSVDEALNSGDGSYRP